MAKKVNDKFDFALIGDGAKLNKLIEATLKTAKSIVGKVHACAVAAAVHAAVHRDTTGISKLVDGLPGGFRKQALLAWMEAKGPMTYVKGDPKAKDEKAKKGRLEFDDAKASDLKSAFETDKQACIKDLMSVNFGDFTVEAEYKGFDLSQLAYALAAKATKVSTGENAADEKTKLDGLDKFLAAVKDIWPSKKSGTKEQKAA